MGIESKPRWILNGAGGRLGRRILAANEILNSENGQGLEFDSINEPAMTAEEFAEALQHDPIHGEFPGKVRSRSGDTMVRIDDHSVAYSSDEEPEDVARVWARTHFGVIDATGAFTKRVDAERYLMGDRVQYVLITAPSEDADCSLVHGINDKNAPYAKALEKPFTPETRIVSETSCTTKSALPVLQPLQDMGIDQVTLLTIHADTGKELRQLLARQEKRGTLEDVRGMPTKLFDDVGDLLERIDALEMDKDLGIGDIDWIRAHTTGAGVSVEQVLPWLKGKMHASSLRVPTFNGSRSIIDIHFGNGNLRSQGVSGLLDVVRKRLLEAHSRYPEGVLRVVDSMPSTAELKIFGRDSAVVPLNGIEHLGGGVVRVLSDYSNETAPAFSAIRTARSMQNTVLGDTPVATPKPATASDEPWPQDVDGD